MKADLSIVFYTANRLHEPFAGHVREQLLKSIDGEFPLIVVSHEPMPGFGDRNIVVENPTWGHLQIYRNILTGALTAETEFLGLAEDDILYSHDHWRTHRPPSYRVSYDLSRWGLNSWCNPPLYGYRNRIVINQLLGPTKYVTDALQERFRKFEGVPEDKIPIQHFCEIGRFEDALGVTPRNFECYASPTPSVVFSHEEAFGYQSRGTRKSIGEFPRKELPFWGSAEKMLSLWTELPDHNVARPASSEPNSPKPNPPGLAAPILA